MNFRERFEAWHKAKYGYANPPKPGHTAFNTEYQHQMQQARWEAWQASSNNSWDLGFAAGVESAKKEVQS